MTPAKITAAASEYLAGFDSPAPIAAIAERGTSEEDDFRLAETYGEDWPAVALEVQRLCRDRVAVGTPGRLWALGAPGPEMEAIKSLLADAGETVVYAANDRGERVHPGSAYRATTLITEAGNHPHTGGVSHVYLVECELLTPEREYVPGEDMCHPELSERTVVRIDHHRPGDPGYGRPPAEFLPASSIGQVMQSLAHTGGLGGRANGGHGGPAETGSIFRRPDNAGRPRWCVQARLDGQRWAVYVSHQIVLTAAADHCLAAAYRGECPGVDPDELMRWRVTSRAAFQGRDEADLIADVESTRLALRDAEDIYIDLGPMPGGETDYERLADMRRDPPYPELPEAAAREGLGYISGPLVGPDGRRKITCAGSVSQVEAFIRHWAPAEGLVDIYGDPQRGLAGGYLP